MFYVCLFHGMYIISVVSLITGCVPSTKSRNLAEYDIELSSYIYKLIVIVHIKTFGLSVSEVFASSDLAAN